MTDERSYPAGVPCWVDTEPPDVDAARHFYANLFGWAFVDAIPADVPGTYLIASLDGATVARALGCMEGVLNTEIVEELGRERSTLAA